MCKPSVALLSHPHCLQYFHCHIGVLIASNTGMHLYIRSNTEGGGKLWTGTELKSKTRAMHISANDKKQIKRIHRLLTRPRDGKHQQLSYMSEESLSLSGESYPPGYIERDTGIVAETKL